MLCPPFLAFFCYYPDIIQIIPDFLWVFLGVLVRGLGESLFETLEARWLTQSK